MAITIGGLARRAGCTVPTIRHYETVGLLAEADRGTGGHRQYRVADAERLIFIRRCRAFGMSVSTIKALLAASDAGKPCDVAASLVRAQQNVIKARMADLRSLDATLSGLIERCDATCASSPKAECCIYSDLAEGVALQAT